MLGILSSALIISCSEDEPGKTEVKTYPKAVLNIAHASSLAIVEEPSGRVAENAANFYKITANGSFEEVKFVNPDGTDIDPTLASPVVKVEKIINLNASYLLLSGTFSVSDTLGHSQTYSSLLVRKNDGAIYNYESNDIALKSRLGEGPLKYDASNNIYYSNGTGVNKLTISDPSKISKIEYLPTGQKAEYFDIDAKGICVYKYGESSGVTNSNGTNDIRLKKLNGGIFEVKVEGRDNREFWLGSNGAIYFTTYTWSNGFIPAIHKINVNNNDISISNVWSSDNTSTYPGVGKMFRTTSQGAYKILKGNSVLFIDTYQSSYGSDNSSWEFFEDTNEVVNISLPRMEQESIIISSSQFYYIATGTDLYKVNINTHQYTKLLNSGEYEVYAINVDDNDNIQFSGLRFDDGKKIFAKINKDGVLTIVDAELDRKATVLERLN